MRCFSQRTERCFSQRTGASLRELREAPAGGTQSKKKYSLFNQIDVLFFLFNRLRWALDCIQLAISVSLVQTRSPVIGLFQVRYCTELSYLSRQPLPRLSRYCRFHGPRAGPAMLAGPRQWQRSVMMRVVKYSWFRYMSLVCWFHCERSLSVRPGPRPMTVRRSR
jgi:hypothetical protein